MNMKLNNEKIIRISNRALKRLDEYKKVRELEWGENYQISYILEKNNEPQNIRVFANICDEEDRVISFNPFLQEEPIWHWGFNYERDLYDYLINDYTLIHMIMPTHCFVWEDINEFSKKEIYLHDGIQKYLAYCKKNKITLEKIQEFSGLNIPNVMRFYKKNKVLER